MGVLMGDKVCSKCGELKSEDEYPWRRPGLRRCECRKCRRDYEIRYRSEHSEHIKELARRYFSENREKLNEYDRNRHASNREAVRKYNREYYATHYSNHRSDRLVEKRAYIEGCRCEIIESYKNYESTKDIGNRLGISIRDVRRIIKESGTVWCTPHKPPKVVIKKKRVGRKSVWGKYVEEWAELYKGGMNLREIADLYSCSLETVRKVLMPTGITVPNNRLTCYHGEWIELYKGGMGCVEISRLYNCAASSVSVVTEKYGIRRSRKEAHQLAHVQKYGEADNYFDNIDTEEKAYYLGYIVADGCIFERKSNGEKALSIFLQVTDGYIIERLGSILRRNVLVRPPKGKDKEQRGLRVTSAHIYDTLRSYGITERKSYDNHEATVFNHIPPDLMSHFLRGLIDGDGCIIAIRGRRDRRRDSGRISLCGNRSDMQGVADIFTSIGCRSAKVRKRLNIYGVTWGSMTDLRNIIHYLYDNATIYLDRKKRVAEEILSVIDNTDLI
jgi:hypothetical protein